jgi:hypothetical protein
MNGEVRQWGASRWCEGPGEVWTDDDGPVPMSAHMLCAMRRWHDAPDPDHVDDDELESWMCTCSCHPEPPPRVDCGECGTAMVRLGSVDVPHTDAYHAAWRAILMRRLVRALYGSVAVRMGHRVTCWRITPQGAVLHPVCRCGWKGSPAGPADAAHEGRNHLVEMGTIAADIMAASGSFVNRMRNVLDAPGATMDEIDLATAGILRLADGMACQCCTFGNHSIRCTCDGSDCCHPKDYLMYNPAWGHGKGR